MVWPRNLIRVTGPNCNGRKPSRRALRRSGGGGREQNASHATVHVHQAFAACGRPEQGLAGTFDGELQSRRPCDSEVAVHLQLVVLQIDDDDFTTSVTGDLTLTAGWQENEPPAPVTHTVTFDSAGGSPVEPQTVADGAAAIDPGTPERDGYKFTGWLLDGEPFDFSTPITGDITLVAGWEESEEPAPVLHAVTFDDGTGSTVTVNVQDGETVQEPAAPERDGYEFTGWLLNGEPYDFSTPVTGDITLVAGWEQAEEPDPATTFTVSFRTNGGTTVEQQTITEGGTAAKPADPTREGYEFTGWLLDGQPYDFSTPVTGNITLDAAWRQIASLDELAGVTVTVDGTPVEGFDPTGDGEYRIGEGAKVELTGVPEGWTVIRQETDNGFTFTLTNGARTVVYTFTTATQEEPDTPDKPDEETPATPDPGDNGTDGDGTGESDGEPVVDDASEMADTGSAVLPAALGAILAAMAGAFLHVRRRRNVGKSGDTSMGTAREE